MRHIYFHGLREDLIPVLEMVESVVPLKYTRMGNFLKSNYQDQDHVLDYGNEIPNLGKASAGSSHASDTYLVYKQDKRLELRVFRGNEGVERVCVDQLANPDTVTFTPGGIWHEDIILEGRIATVSDSKISQELMKRFHSAIRKTFVKIKAFYVGPKALELLKSGARLTMSAQSPREFDLTVPL